MKPLDPPDLHHVLAADGWIELGDYSEAQKELEKIAPEYSTHPDVLKVRWRICGKTQDLEAALTVARTICRLEPSHPFSRVHQSEALHVVESPSEVCDQSGIRLPYLFAIPYNLACYACQLGNLEEAWDWLEVAIEISDPGEVKKIALSDPDLEPLWIKLSDI
jgi:hypothetical protein